MVYPICDTHTHTHTHIWKVTYYILDVPAPHSAMKTSTMWSRKTFTTWVERNKRGLKDGICVWCLKNGWFTSPVRLLFKEHDNWFCHYVQVPKLPKPYEGFLKWVPPSHPFIHGDFHEIKHPASLGYPHDFGNLHFYGPGFGEASSLRPVVDSWELRTQLSSDGWNEKNETIHKIGFMGLRGPFSVETMVVTSKFAGGSSRCSP